MGQGEKPKAEPEMSLAWSDETRAFAYFGQPTGGGSLALLSSSPKSSPRPWS